MKYQRFLVVLVGFLSLSFLSGCVLVKSKEPILSATTQTGNVSVAVEGFVSETVDVNPAYGSANTFHSGSGSVSGQPFTYNGTSSTTMNSVTMSRRETAVMCGEIRNMLADMGFVVMSPTPDYIISGTYYGPSNPHGFMDFAAFILSLGFYINDRMESRCEIRVFERSSGRMVKRIVADDKYLIQSFSIVPIFGHLFQSEMWPNSLFPHSTRRVTVKAVNELAVWLEDNATPTQQ